jgi:hypothetical protein
MNFTALSQILTVSLVLAAPALASAAPGGTPIDIHIQVAANDDVNVILQSDVQSAIHAAIKSACKFGPALDLNLNTKVTQYVNGTTQTKIDVVGDVICATP